MNEITTVGVDLAKNVIVVCAGDAAGKTVYFRQFSFGAFAVWAANLPPACSAWKPAARRTIGHGGSKASVTPKLMAAEFVKPFRKSQGAKNDRNDARAILSAMRDADMRFVAPKSADQQAILGWHRMRAGWMAERTALVNRLRGLLAEFGLWFDRSPSKQQAPAGTARARLEHDTARAIQADPHPGARADRGPRSTNRGMLPTARTCSYSGGLKMLRV